MFSLGRDMHAALADSSRPPLILLVLYNALGARVYSDRNPGGEVLDLVSAALADGSLLADGSSWAGEGSMTLLESGARVLSFGRLRETLTPFRGELLASLAQEETGSVGVVLSTVDRSGRGSLARMEAVENLLGCRAELRIGFAEVRAREFITRFRGRVIAYRLEAQRLHLTLRAA